MNPRQTEAVVVRLTEPEFDTALDLAKNRERYWKERGRAAQNWAPNQLTGALGEVAAHRWLGDNDVPLDAAYKTLDRQPEADLIISTTPLRIDVKTGRFVSAYQVSEDQIATLEAKADILLWCEERHETIGYDCDKASCVVTILGWSYVSEILGSKTEHNSDGMSYDFRRPAAVHSPSDLLGLLVSRIQES